MAVDYTPSTWVTGILVGDATYLQIPWTELGDAAQSETDIRNIIRGLDDTIKTHYTTLTGSDVPTKFTAAKNTKYNEANSEFEEKHSHTFDLTVDSTSLATE